MYNGNRRQPQQQVERVKLNVDKDEGGIYKANARRNNEHVGTVEDGHDMYVDMPVDYKKTDQVVHVSYKIGSAV